MKKVLKNLVTKRPARIGVLAVALMIAVSSCNEKEDMAPQEFEDMQDITAVLESFSEEIEFSEVSEDGFKSWRKYKKVPSFRTLLTALIKTDLLRTVARERLTVLAPTDEAFRALGITPRNVGDVENLKEILLYHVLGGKVYSYDLVPGFAETLNGAYIKVSLEDGVFFNDAEVKRADLRALNGVIHIIDKVLLPPTQDIVEKAVSFNPDEFNTLVQAVIRAELVDVLKSEGPFTVFAPTDAAFAALGVDLSTLSKDDLVNILLYHVVPGTYFSTDLFNGEVATANGETVTISLGAGVKVNDSNVIIANVQTTNGVIHVIDKVLIP